MESRDQVNGQSAERDVKIVECPVCIRRYRFDISQMTKDKTKVKCRKCENIFVISRNMFPSAPPETAPPPPPMEEPSASPGQGVHPQALVIKSIPNETARLRIATRLMALTREGLSPLMKRLSKTPVTFSVEVSPGEADGLLKTIESTGAKAEFTSLDVSRVSLGQGGQGFPSRSWKKWVFAAILVFFIVIGGGLSYHMYGEVQKTTALEQRDVDSIIPTGAFLYIHFKDIKENWKRIQGNAAERGLGALFERLKSTRPVQDLVSKKRDLERSMGLPLVGPDLMDFIGSDLRLAFYPGKSPEANQFVLTLKGNLKIKLMETLVKWIPQSFKGSLPRQMDTNGAIYVFRPQGLGSEVYFFSEGLVYIVSSSPDLIRTSISLMDQRLPAKHSVKSISPLFKRVKRTNANQVGTFYVGLQKLIGSWLPNRSSNDGASLPVPLEGHGDIAGAISYGKGLIIESAMAVNAKGLDPPFKGLFECPPAQNKTLAYVPENTILYASNNCLELGSYFFWLRENLKTQPDASRDFNEIIQGINAQTGMDVEKEIVALLGRGFSYAILAPSREGNLPLPGVQLFFPLKDPSKMEASLRQLSEKPVIRLRLKEAGIDLLSVSHEEVPITYLRYQENDPRLFFLSAFTPCYAFVDDILVIGSEVESLKRMVDLSRGRGASMLKDSRLGEMRRFVREKNNGMTYVDLRATSRLINGLTNQGALGGLEKARGQVVTDLRDFLQILEALNYSWSAAQFERDHVRITFYVAL